LALVEVNLPQGGQLLAQAVGQDGVHSGKGAGHKVLGVSGEYTISGALPQADIALSTGSNFWLSLIPRLLTSMRRFGFWVGPVLLFGSLLIAWPLIVVAAYFPPAVLLLLLPLGGLVLGIGLIIGSTQPLWAKLLALLSPVLLPLLIVAIVGGSLPAEDHLTFLIPVDFRGEVAVVQQDLTNVYQERVKGDITLTVPANGLITTTAYLSSKQLKTADYYLINSSGERVIELRQLDYLSTNANFASSAERTEWRRIGIFTMGLHYKTIPLSYGCTNCPVQKTPYISFLVGRYDSLDSGRYTKSPF
jgi:hypothetical protein